VTVPDIKIGAFDVIATDSVVLGQHGNLLVSLEALNEQLAYEFVFETDAENKEARFLLEAVRSDRGRLKFTNFNSPLGIGYTEPVYIGALGPRPLAFTMITHALGGGSGRVVTYTFLLAPSRGLINITDAPGGLPV
jgi:hypothetical protein